MLANHVDQLGALVILNQYGVEWQPADVVCRNQLERHAEYLDVRRVGGELGAGQRDVEADRRRGGRGAFGGDADGGGDRTAAQRAA